MDIQKDKQVLLDSLEANALNLGGELAMMKIGYSLNMDRVETYLGAIIDAILDLKRLEGIPTNLKKVEE